MTSSARKTSSTVFSLSRKCYMLEISRSKLHLLSTLFLSLVNERNCGLFRSCRHDTSEKSNSYLILAIDLHWTMNALLCIGVVVCDWLAAVGINLIDWCGDVINPER